MLLFLAFVTGAFWHSGGWAAFFVFLHWVFSD